MSSGYTPDSVVSRAERNLDVEFKSGTSVFVFQGYNCGLPTLCAATVCTSGDIMEYCSVVLEGHTEELWLPKDRVYTSPALAWDALAAYAHAQNTHKS